MDLDLPNLLINIWSYTDYLHDPIVKQYEKWCAVAAKLKWRYHYLDFDYVISNLKRKKKKFYDFGKISSADRNVIYRIIHKWYLTQILFCNFSINNIVVKKWKTVS